MSVQITEAFVQQYKTNVYILSQQRKSRAREWVREEALTGKAHFFERVAATTAYSATSRHADTQYVDTPHSRRRVSPVTKRWADLIDTPDKVRTLIDPKSIYAENGAYAMNRAIDDIILAAANGNAYSGEDGSTVVALPAGQKIAVGTTNLTLAKALAAKETLDLADVDPDEPKVMVVSPNQITAMLNTTEVKSADYNTVKALAKGEIDTFLGFRWVVSNRLTKTGNVRYCLCWAKRGMGLAIAEDIVTKIDELPTKNYSVQVFLEMDMGATRIEDECMVEIACDETA